MTVAAIKALGEFVPESMMVMEMDMLRCFYPNAEIRKRKAADLDYPPAKRRLLFRNEDGMNCVLVILKFWIRVILLRN